MRNEICIETSNILKLLRIKALKKAVEPQKMTEKNALIRNFIDSDPEIKGVFVDLSNFAVKLQLRYFISFFPILPPQIQKRLFNCAETDVCHQPCEGGEDEHLNGEIHLPERGPMDSSNGFFPQKNHQSVPQIK